jgi:hypothetical protein
MLNMARLRTLRACDVNMLCALQERNGDYDVTFWKCPGDQRAEQWWHAVAVSEFYGQLGCALGSCVAEVTSAAVIYDTA